MATIEVATEVGNLYVRVPAANEYQAVAIIQRLLEDIHALVNLMEYGSVSITIDKKKED